MAALKVSEFDDADTLDGSELVGLVQGTENRKATLAEIALITGIEEWAPNWNVDLDLYIPAPFAMTIDQGVAQIGTGDIAYAKSTAAAPDTFNDTTLPAVLEEGAWLRLRATGVNGFLATHLVRTA